MVTLTEPQRKVARFIWEQLKTTGVPPTLREIARKFEWKAVGSAQDVVSALRRKGVLVESERGKARQIILASGALEYFESEDSDATSSADFSVSSVAAQSGDVLWVPLLGQVQAGLPHEAVEARGELVPFAWPGTSRKAGASFFALVVEGYSMLNAGFLPGDYLLVERAHEASNGDVVVACPSPGEATVKRYAVRGSELYRRAMETLAKFPQTAEPLPPAFLVPENPLFEPIPFAASEECKILGLVKSLFRPAV